MALLIRTLTVATTVDDVVAHFPGGIAALRDAQPGAVRIGRLVRLQAPIAGLRCGTWAAWRGAYAVELVPHPDIRVVAGRRRKSAGLVHRTVRLRDEPPPRPEPPRDTTGPARLRDETAMSVLAAVHGGHRRRARLAQGGR